MSTVPYLEHGVGDDDDRSSEDVGEDENVELFQRLVKSGVARRRRRISDAFRRRHLASGVHGDALRGAAING